MLKYITALMAASVALVGALENPAHSASGIWAELNGWTVQAETDFMSCEAFATFDNGVSLSFVYDGETWLFSLIGRSVIPTFVYDAAFIFDGQTSIMARMEALSHDTLSLTVTDEFMSLMRKSYALEIGDAYGFNLSGSAKAIDSAIACQHTLTELVPNTTTSTGAESWGWDQYNERI